MKRKTKEQFICEAQKIYGNKYDYSKVDYVNNYTEIIVICKNCGYEFKIIPYLHLRGVGCQNCSTKKSTSHIMTMEYFLKKAHEKHGNKFDYSKVDLLNRDENGKVTIICPIHGEFKQNPSTHLKSGCKQCHMEKLANSKKLTTETFIERAKKIHGDKYDYSNTIYECKRKKVTIKCKTCGHVFNQYPLAHLNGEGCKICNFSKLETEIKELLNENNIEHISQCRKDVLEWLGRQSLDFYLPKYNVAIECQGSFHFDRNDYFGGEDGLKNCKKRDEKKYNLCKKNNVKIIYYAKKPIPQNYFDKIYTNKDELLKALNNLVISK